jgi:hypothetical protein
MPMTKTPAGGAADQDLLVLLTDILTDLEHSLATARNKAAKKLLHDRMSRVKRAIGQVAAARPLPQLAHVPRAGDRLPGPDSAHRPLVPR